MPSCGARGVRNPLAEREEFARENGDVKVVKVNVDYDGDLAADYNIGAIPALLVFKNGQVSARTAGLADKRTLRALVER